MHFTLAHFSDLHLGPLNGADVFRNFKLKRLIGGSSWILKRRKLHRAHVSEAVRASMMAAKPDHFAFTGDLVNIAAWSEFTRGAQWLSAITPDENLTVVPGNHDCYVAVDAEHGLNHLAKWMQSSTTDQNRASSFPFVKLRRNVALIGLNSGVPQSLHRAGGELGDAQLQDLEHHLVRLGSQGFCRIVLIHHPPLPGLAKQRKSLVDAEELQSVLERNGCELVLHGHNHRFMQNTLQTKSGIAHIIGAPSASHHPSGHHETGGWNEFRIRRQAGQWQIEIARHSWQPEKQLVAAQPFALLSPA